MTKFYTNIAIKGDDLLIRECDNGIRSNYQLKFNPTIWMTSHSPSSTWKTMTGQSVYPIQPGSISNTREYIQEHINIKGQEIYQSPGHVYQYIAEQYPDTIEWTSKDVSIFTIDIETTVENGFPDPIEVNETVLLITIHDILHKKIITWGLYPYNGERSDVEYRHCITEQDLFRDFLSYWTLHYPDIITGWSSNTFDNTYLYNRMTKVLGKVYADKLSPWDSVRLREIQYGGKTIIKTYFKGIAGLDYLELYKKFKPGIKESYKLDFIAQEELGQNKLKNPGTSFKDFYTNYWDTFCSYNIRDVELVSKLDEKLKLIDLTLAMAYDAKINYEDVFSPVKTWDIIIYNYLNNNKIVIPNKNPETNKDSSYDGGYVKTPLVGRHRWACSEDVNSMYPNLIILHNISPETLLEKKYSIDINRLLKQDYDLTFLRESNASMAANGCCFTRSKLGVLPYLMQSYYDKRIEYKNKMMESKKQLEELDSQQKDYNEISEKLQSEISVYNLKQTALKLLLNSCYGATGNVGFRYYDLRIAEGITISGQVTIRWISNKLNTLMNKIMKTENKDYIILGDTDSVVVSLEALVESQCKDRTLEEKIAFMDKFDKQILQPYIENQFQIWGKYINAYTQSIHMKRENLVDVMLSVSKKRYVMSVCDSEGVYYHNPKLKIMGLQMVKSSTPKLIRAKLKDALSIILHKDEKDIQQYVKQVRHNFNQLSADDIAFPRGVSNLRKFESAETVYQKKDKNGNKNALATPIHVRGALLFNHYIKKKKLDKIYEQISEGDKIKFLYLRLPNPIKENIIAYLDVLPPELGLDQYIDYDIMFIKTFLDVINNVLVPLNWSSEKIETLDDFFV